MLNLLRSSEENLLKSFYMNKDKSRQGAFRYYQTPYDRWLAPTNQADLRAFERAIKKFDGRSWEALLYFSQPHFFKEKSNSYKGKYMTKEYRNFIRLMNECMGENVERYTLLVGFLIIGTPIYCLLVLLHIHLVGLKKGDYDIATTFLPLFYISNLLTYLGFFYYSIEFLDLNLFLVQMISLYVLLVLTLEIVGQKEWSQKICFKLIPLKESLYSRKFSSEQNHKNNKGENLEDS